MTYYHFGLVVEQALYSQYREMLLDRGTQADENCSVACRFERLQEFSISRTQQKDSCFLFLLMWRSFAIS